MSANHRMPIYVTRPTADGETGQLYVPVWTALVVVFLAWWNAVAWGIVGLIAAVETIA